MKYLITASLALSLAFLLSCSAKTTALVGSWPNPDRTDLGVSKILVIGNSEKEQVRRTFEREARDHINKTSRHTTALASLEEMKVDEELTKEALMEHFQNQGIDAVLITRVVDSKSVAEWNEGDHYYGVSPYANDWWAYYRRLIVDVPEPGSFSPGREVQVESSLLDANTGEPIWKCATKSFDQGDTVKVLDQIVKTIVKQMKEDGVIS